MASSLSTGVVLETGDGVTRTVPIYEGYALPHAILHLNLSGHNVTYHLINSLIERGHFDHFSTLYGRETAKNIKEKHAYISLDYYYYSNQQEQPLETSKTTTTYEMPDGQTIALGAELFHAPEILFRPSIFGLEITHGIHEILHDSINKCDVDIRNELMYANIVLGGGNTMFPGFAERMSKEITALATPSGVNNVKVVANAGRKYSAWIGGSVFASLNTFQQMWITKGEYEECGARIVHRKCF